MTTVNTYLTFNGNCEEAFNFYKDAFGGDFDHIGKFSDMPENPEFPVAKSDKNKVMHVSFSVGNTTLMGSDTGGGEWAEKYNPGNNFSVSINADSRKEADRLFSELSENGKVIMSMNKTFWGSYFGMFVDKFKVQWMVSVNELDRKK